ncbi:heterokaryon incompatibility protein-domain-containing protein [Biscogniauxia marginata]|nr:heterokaryon incompatibility protein-domain-containing protein [Biscogniauxia marginata]
MRLLHTKTLELHTFIGGDDVPPYTVLSHTWGDDEVTFEDMSRSETRTKKQGWDKIVNFCRRAAADGWEYGWIDTCCINKTDASELGEAINSMFRLYEESEVCYAYLTDVPPKYALSPSASDARGVNEEDRSNNNNKVPWKWYFRSSKWFTRGWTLQELLAPSFLLFLDWNWDDIGSREAWATEVHAATGIETKQLWDFKSCSIATKLSWASGRRTTRVEDRAYSLLGLLGVNMPLIYGEGKRAFVRLQHELIRAHNDETIFAWGDLPVEDHVLSVGDPADILASSPEDFQFSSGLMTWPFDQHRRFFAMTNAGLSMNAEIFEFTGKWTGEKPLCALRLNCTSQPLNSRRTPTILFLYALDPDRTIFERAGKIFRDWNDVSTITWKSLGRLDIIITHHQSDDHHRRLGPCPSYTISFDVGSLGALRDIETRWYDERWTCVDASHSSAVSYNNKADVSANGAMSRTITRVRHAARGESFAIVVRSGPRAPQFGIWRCDGPLGTQRVIEELESAERRREGVPYPAAARSHDGKMLHISARPVPVPRALMPKRGSLETPNKPTKKAFLVEVVVEAAEKDFGDIGRFTRVGSTAGSDSSATFVSVGGNGHGNGEGDGGEAPVPAPVPHNIKRPTYHHPPPPAAAPNPTPAPAAAPTAAPAMGIGINDTTKKPKPKPKAKPRIETFTNNTNPPNPRTSRPTTPRPVTPTSTPTPNPRRPPPPPFYIHHHPYTHPPPPPPAIPPSEPDYDDDIDIDTPTTETESESSVAPRPQPRPGPRVSIRGGKKLRFASDVKAAAADPTSPSLPHGGSGDGGSGVYKQQQKQQPQPQPQPQTFAAPAPPAPMTGTAAKRERDNIRRSWIPNPPPVTVTTTTTTTGDRPTMRRRSTTTAAAAAMRRQNPFFAGVGPGPGPGTVGTGTGTGTGVGDYGNYSRGTMEL